MGVVIALGEKKKLMEYVKKEGQEPLNPFNIEKHIKHLIQIEIKNSPESVGPPIDILELKSDGYRWIERKNTTPVKL